MFDILDAVLERAQARGAADVEVFGELVHLAPHQGVPPGGRAAHGGAAPRRGRARVLRRRGGPRLYLGPGATARSTTSERAVDNAAVSDPDEFAALPQPGGEPADVHPFDPRLEAATDEQRIAVALEVEATALAADPRVKTVEDTMYVDGDGEVFIASTAGVRGSVPRRPVLRVRLRARRAGRPGRDRLLLQRRPRASRSSTLPASGTEADRAGDPAARRDEVPVDEGAGDPRPVRLGGVLRRAQLGAHRRRRAEGPVAVRRPRGRARGRRAPRARRRRHARGRPRQRAVRRRRRARRGARRSSRAACCRASCTTRTRRARPAATSTGQRHARRVLGPARRAPERTSSSPDRRRRWTDIVAGTERGVLVTDAVGIHSGANPISGEFSVGISGVLIEGGEVHRRRCGRSRSPATSSAC